MNTTTTRKLGRSVPAIVLALAVLVVGLAGTATAAKLITGKQIKNSSVTAADIKNGTLGEADLNKKVKDKLNAPAVKGYEVVTQSESIPTAGQGTVNVACTAGKVAVAGGGTWDDSTVSNEIVASSPRFVIRGDALLFDEPKPGFADGWMVEGRHNGLDPHTLTAYVVCVQP